MRTLITSALSILAIATSFADLTPSQVDAKATLEKNVKMDEYRGSIYAQAKLDGIDYRPILRQAIDLDEAAIRSLFTMNFMGEGGESHSENLLLLMKLWGDDRFSKALSGKPAKTRDLVIILIDYAWADPEWDIFSKTLAMSPDSITKRTKAESGPGE